MYLVDGVGKNKNIEVQSKWWQSKKVTIDVESQTLNILHINFGEKALSIPKIEYSYDKPVIYFYPEKEQQVDVKLNVNGKMCCNGIINTNICGINKRFKWF